MSQQPEGQESIRSIVSKVFQDIQKRRAIDDIRDVWKDVVGDRFSEHSAVMSCQNGRLVVHVDRSEWLYEMHARREGWLEQLRQHPKGESVRQIILRIGHM